jgi:hypothetical protein
MKMAHLIGMRHGVAALRELRDLAKRLEVFDRDGWQCDYCGAENVELVAHRLGNVCRWSWDYQYPTEPFQTLCVDCASYLKGTRPGSVDLIPGGGWSYDGRCPWCYSENIKDKGSFDKCMDCGRRMSFSPTPRAAEG